LFKYGSDADIGFGLQVTLLASARSKLEQKECALSLVVRAPVRSGVDAELPIRPDDEHLLVNMRTPPSQSSTINKGGTVGRELSETSRF